MRVIYKYPLDFDNPFIDMPSDARILRAELQDDVICIWALVTPNLPHGKRKIGIYGTGFTVPDTTNVYIGTVFTGMYVWHLFDEGWLQEF